MMIKAEQALVMALGLLLGACAGSQVLGDGEGQAAVLSTSGADWPLDLGQALEESGRVALIWYAPWCVPCEAEAPELANAAIAMEGRIRFVGIVAGGEQDSSAAEIRAFRQRHALTYPTLRDEQGAMTRAFGITGTPTIVVLEKGPKELYRGNTAPDWDSLK
jgi:thiol-disulfide isomerase/thioredoxin